MRMTAIVLSRAGKNDHDAATKNEELVTTKPKLGGAIAAGILAGAVAAVLVGGLVGVTESSSSVVTVGHSVSAP
jgi:hypothetical protein